MPQELKNIIHKLIQPKEAWKFTLLTNWNTIIGNLGTKVCLEKIQDDTLVLGVYDACWMQELYMLSHLLITRINQSLDQPRIKQVRFKRAALSCKRPRIQAQKTNLPQTASVCTVLTLKQKAALESIKDPHLKTALKDFLIRCSKEQV